MQKATYGAIDEMRTDGVIRRKEAARRPKVFHLVEKNADGEMTCIDLVDKGAIRENRRLEQRDLCAALLSKLCEARPPAHPHVLRRWAHVP